MSTIVPNVLEQCTQAWVQFSQTLSTFYKTRSFAVCSVVKILLLSVGKKISVLIFLFVVQSTVNRWTFYNAIKIDDSNDKMPPC